MIKLNLADRIKLLRLEKNLTQEDLAKVCNLTRSTIARYENNFSRPSDEIKIKIATYFKVSLDFLNGLSDIRAPLNLISSNHDYFNIPIYDNNLDEILNYSLVHKNKILDTNYIYYYSKFDFTESRILKDDLLLIKLKQSFNTGDIILFKYNNDLSMARAMTILDDAILYNNCFTNKFLQLKLCDIEVIGIVVEVTFSLKK